MSPLTGKIVCMRSVLCEQNKTSKYVGGAYFSELLNHISVNAHLNHLYFVPDYSFFSCVGKCVNKQMAGEM